MNDNRIYFEKIRSFILGRMTEEESSAFELELKQNEGLREEYERLKEISSAASAARVSDEEYLRAVLKQAETEFNLQERSINRFELDQDLEQVERELADLEGKGWKKRLFDHIRQLIDTTKAWFTPKGTVNPSFATSGNTVLFKLSYISRMALSLAVAASLVFAIVLPISHYHMANLGYEEAGKYLMPENGLVRDPRFRGDEKDKIESLVKAAKVSLQKGDNKQAINKLTEAESIIDSKLELLHDDDSAILTIAELNADKQDILWLRALALMRDKQVSGAKRALRAIVKGNGEHSEEASRILQAVY